MTHPGPLQSKSPLGRPPLRSRRGAGGVLLIAALLITFSIQAIGFGLLFVARPRGAPERSTTARILFCVGALLGIAALFLLARYFRRVHRVLSRRRKRAYLHD